MRFKLILFSLCIFLCVSLFLVNARTKESAEKSGSRLYKPTTGKVPTIDAKYHNVGNMWLCVWNRGQFGNYDAVPLPSCEFPAGSDVEYLFCGAIWIGALVGDDTLCSFGADGWDGGFELAPGWDEGDTILVRSIRNPQDTLAVSEQDYIAVCNDTSLLIADLDEEHIPMGVQIESRSYAWSYSYAEDFVIFDFYIKNVSAWIGEPKTFKDLFMGVYIDGDCGHQSTSRYAGDDITGFLKTNAEGDTINLAWLSDNDGDAGLCPGVTGVRVLFPDPETVCYNWWAPDKAWGPTNPSNPYDWADHPRTDGQKYRIMSNGEIDPDQMACTWAPPNVNIEGMDTRYFLSFGPFNVEPDSTLKLTLAYVGGLPGPGFDKFEDLGRNARWARDVYDNPPADGIPDFKGPPPPPSPRLIVTPGDKQVALKWENSPEYAVDSFSKLVDFQGYRIYRSHTGVISEMELLGDYDKIDGYGLNLGFDEIYPEVEVDANGDTTIWYNYTDVGLTNGEYIYYAVTAYDSGYAPTGLEPLESSPAINLTRVAPSAGPASAAEMDEVLVIPNPYRIDEDYVGMGWQIGSGDTQRRIDFVQIPPKCTIRIFTIAGDLVAVLDHDFPAGKSPIEHRESWDVISRNIQAVSSGIYLFSVEAEGKNYVGKFTIIY